MRLAEIAGRMTGFSTPIFGVSWEPPTVDREVARRVLAYLEDKRVLYSPSEAELPEHCVQSVLEMRRFLTGLIGSGGIADEIVKSLRAMRAACRQFLDDVGVQDGRDDFVLDRFWRRRGGYTNGLSDYVLNQALGRLRGVFGIHIGQLALKYGIEVEDQLASTLPSAPEQ